MPPERSAPSGTSATIRRTDGVIQRSSSSARNRLLSSPRVSRCFRPSVTTRLTSQKGVCGPGRPPRTVTTWPGRSFLIPRKTVQGDGM